MTAKFNQARKDAFLAAVAETGNQTLAAERAKVSRSWVQLHRSSDPGFKRRLDEALQEAKAALRHARHERGGGVEPPSGWGFLDGAELVVKGTGGSGGGKRVQIARARLKQWSPRVEERFLATLAATCNVKAACAEVGMTPASAYGHRNRWPAFGERWKEAVELGYSRLEIGLIEAACNLFSGEGLPQAEPLHGMTADHALRLLHMHKHEVRGVGRRPGWRAREPDIEEVRAEILRKVAAIKKARERSGEERARDREEWTQRGAGQARPAG